MSGSDILKKNNTIVLIDKKFNSRTSGIIVNTTRRVNTEAIYELNAIDTDFDKRLFLDKDTLLYEDFIKKRFKKLVDNNVSRVVAYYDEDRIEYLDYSKKNITLSDNSKFIPLKRVIERTFSQNNENWYKATIMDNDGINKFKIKFDDGEIIEEIGAEYIIKLDEVYDINIVNILTVDGFKTLRNISRGEYNIEIEMEDGVFYNIIESGDPSEINKMKKLKAKYDKMSKSKNKKTKYNLKWFYKTNYSGSRYFPLKISNVELLSEADKYAQVDKYTELKEGDIVKYNYPSHPNHNLLAKVTGIREDPLNKRNYYDRKKYIYSIRFEPFETYIDPAELNEYQEKYENITNTIPNVTTDKLLKFKYVEKEHYDVDINKLLNDGVKLNNFNNVISENTLERLRKNTKFNLDFILAKYQPVSNVKDLNKLIKPNNTTTYSISHSPNIQKRPSGLFFDTKIRPQEDNKNKIVDVDIYVDLTLFQSKMITEEEWNKKPLVGKLGNILGEQIKNSYAGVLNCPNRFDKLKTIMKGIANKKWFIDLDASEDNLIKQSFNKTAKKIKEVKKRINDMEDEKMEISTEIKNSQSMENPHNSYIAEKQVELGEKEQEIKTINRQLIELESILKQKGGRKTRRNKNNNKPIKRKTTHKSKTMKRRNHKINKTRKKCKL